MNTVVLITFMVGSVLTKAPFPDMDACNAARAEVLLQKVSRINAICVYDKEKIKPEMMVKKFLNSVDKSLTCEEKSK